MRTEERPYVMHEHSRAHGRKSVTAVCPFCDATVVIYLWALAGNGKKLCPCGAALHDDRVARKLVELSSDASNRRAPGRDADGEPGNTSE